MTRFIPLSALAATAMIAFALPAAAQSYQEQQRFDQAQRRFDSEYRIYRDAVDRYTALRDRGGPAPAPYPNQPQYQDNGYRQAAPDDRYEQGYDPGRYYRNGPNYQERVMTNDERVYAGNDGRYYCKRSDGTTGLIVGGAAGGVLGNVIDGGRSRTVGTLLGAAAGALAGKAVDQQNSEVRCR